MQTSGSTGVFFYNRPDFSTDLLDYRELINYARKFPIVQGIWQLTDFAWNEENIIRKIRENNLERIVIAGSFPGIVKTLFTKAMSNAGKDPLEVWLAGFDEKVICTSGDMNGARSMLACAIEGISYELAAVPEENPVNPVTLVIGGGIAGIQASLEIAASNNRVYLVEKTGTIGGKMATFDKTFPTLDCAACILTPKMVEVNQNPNIKLMTCCDVKDVSGEPGNYKVRILKRSRKVNVQTCIGCGTCAEKCPVQVPSEFDSGTTLRKAIYIPFPQAVPNKYLVDPENCIYLKTGKCKACTKACPVPGCINLDGTDEEITLEVGNIIVATGFKPLDAT
ncbi:MAG: FAD-dependent oxidoreductase, partial [Bacteroidota bacterium]|nr:FAD-dependent oxidoreductase [Bacteroidota bacterium]